MVTLENLDLAFKVRILAGQFRLAFGRSDMKTPGYQEALVPQQPLKL